MRYLFLCLLLGSTTVAAEPDKDLHRKCVYPTVALISMTAEKTTSGTAVIVKSVKENGEFCNYALACAHSLARLNSKKEIRIPEGPHDPESILQDIDDYAYFVRIGKYKNWSTLIGFYDSLVYVLYEDDARDIALIKFYSPFRLNVAEIDEKPEPYIGDEIIRVGCGLQEFFRLDHGRITSVAGSINRPVLMGGTHRISAPTVPGDSGGPVYLEYKLIGLTQAMKSLDYKSTEIPVFHMCYVIPIERFLECPEIAEHLND